ncbi:MAG: hypothetical protein ABW039_11105 [Sphingobium sp.]
MSHTIFRNDLYIVERHEFAPSDHIVICFDSWRTPQTLDVVPFGHAYLKSRGINHICVNTGRNSWYQEACMDEIAALIRAATLGLRRIGYGSSMGGFGALNYYAALGLDDALVFCPQYSIDPALVPFEKRWLAEAAAIDFRSCTLATPGAVSRATIVYDPFNVDARHVALIRAHNPVTLFKIPFSGHDPAEYLRRANLVANFTADFITGNFDAVAYRRALRARRRENGRFWLNFSKALWVRGNRDGAVEAARRAEACAPDSTEAAAHFANLSRLHQPAPA